MLGRVRTRASVATLVACGSCWLAPAGGLAAAGDLDETFGGDGLVTTADVYSLSDAASGVDGSVVVSGSSLPDPNAFPSTSPIVARYRPDGTLDPSFGSGGIVVLPGRIAVREVVPAPDGKTYAISTDYASPMDSVVTRLDRDGHLDPTFGTGGSAEADFTGSGEAFDAQMTAAGDLVVAGPSYLDSAANYDAGLEVIWFTPDGRLDSSISGDGRFRIGQLGSVGTGGVIVLDRDVTYVAFDGYDRSSRVVKLDPQGAVETSYGTSGVAELPSGGAIAGAGLAPSGDLITVEAACQSTHVGVLCGRGSGYLRRLDRDGAVDSSFGRNGLASTEEDPAGLTVASDGDIYVAATYPVATPWTHADFALERFTAQGAPDRDFSSDGLVTTDFDFQDDYVRSLVAMPDGKLLLSGGNHIARYETAAGPPDADADALLDTQDDCPHRYSQRARGCPALETSLSLKARGRKLVGRLRGTLAECFVARPVLIERLGGTDRAIKARTDDHGRFEIRGKSLRSGRYTATVGARPLDPVGECLAVRSDPIAVGPGRG